MLIAFLLHQSHARRGCDLATIAGLLQSRQPRWTASQVVAQRPFVAGKRRHVEHREILVLRPGYNRGAACLGLRKAEVVQTIGAGKTFVFRSRHAFHTRDPFQGLDVMVLRQSRRHEGRKRVPVDTSAAAGLEIAG